MAWQNAVSQDAMRRRYASGQDASSVRVAILCQCKRISAQASIAPLPHPSRRAFLRLSVAVSAVAAADSLLSNRANAVCGEPDPFFAHYLDWAEGLASGPNSRNVHYRCVGSRKKEQKAGKFPVIYIGDAGVGIASGETFELLGETERRIVMVDLLGVGDSDKLPGHGFNLSRSDAVALAREEVLAVLGALGIGGARAKEPQSLHVVACGFGLEVTDALMRACEDAEIGKTINLKIASVAAEGWTPVKAEKSGDISFAALQGTRVCAVEGAEGGDISIVRKLYEPGRGSGESPIVSAIESISKRVPTLALRSFDTRPLDESVMGKGLFTEHVFSQAGRIAHLAGAEDTMKAVDDFFTQIEGPKQKA